MTPALAREAINRLQEFDAITTHWMLEDLKVPLSSRHLPRPIVDEIADRSLLTN